jgi:hypothetical protein
VAPAAPTKKLTANRLQFFGIITSEYLDQINPVETTKKFFKGISSAAVTYLNI